jgi:protein-S-isoprenylcysteine O-methyltransferase Ste14
MQLSTAILDRAERLVLAAFYAFFTYGMIRGVAETGAVFNLLILAAEFCTLALILLRKPADAISRRPSDWMLALCATTLPLLVRPSDAGAIGPAMLGAGLILFSIVAQLASKLSLGRSFGVVPANRAVVTRGAYRIVRHPIYASYVFAHVGFCLLNPSAWNVCVYLAAFWLQIARLLREETLLNQSEAYRAYAGAVRHRLLPGVF